MSSLLEKWNSYCKGSSEHESSDFIGLLKQHSTPDELAIILGYFPNSEAMSARLSKVLDSGTLNERPYLFPLLRGSQESLMMAAQSWLSERARFCDLTGDQRLALIARSAIPKFFERPDNLPLTQRDLPERWIFDHISDEFWDALPFSKGPVFGLLEALYGLAADYYLAWYIATPLFDFQLDCSKYFEFWRQGGISVLTNTELLVSRRQ